jgi:hypothetical protein
VSRDVYRARVRHFVYVTLYCCLVAIATVVHQRHIAYSMHVTIYIDMCIYIQYLLAQIYETALRALPAGVVHMGFRSNKLSRFK